MKKFLWVVILLCLTGAASGQKTLVVEKIGTGRKFGYNPGDFMKVKTRDPRQLLRSYMTDLTDSTVSIGTYHTVRLDNIKVVYKRYGFPLRLGSNLLLAGGIFFVATTVNNLIVHNQVFTQTNLIITGSILAAGTICIILSENPMHIGLHWKIKILDIPHL